MRRAKIILAVGLVLATLPGWATAGGDGTVNTGELPADCVKFDSDVVGTAPIEATVDGVTVKIEAWTVKPGEEGEYIGFTYTVAGGTFDYLSVKSGKDDIDAAYEIDTAWAHVNAWSNEVTDDVKAISNVVFCGAQLPPPPPPDDDPDF